MLVPQQAEQLRNAIAVYLAPRHPLKFSAAAIAMQIKNLTLLDFAADAEAVAAACNFLRELNLVEKQTAGLGSTVYYGATAQCVLRFERGEL